MIPDHIVFLHLFGNVKIAASTLEKNKEHNTTLLLVFRCVDQPSVTGNGKLISVSTSSKDTENQDKVNI